jgi:hypothetical protein
MDDPVQLLQHVDSLKIGVAARLEMRSESPLIRAAENYRIHLAANPRHPDSSSCTALMTPHQFSSHRYDSDAASDTPPQEGKSEPHFGGN